MPGLLNTNLKVKWAKKHLDSLSEAITDFRANPDKTQRITTYEDLEKDLFVIKCETIDEDDWLFLGLLAGDFIANLRSSLDHLAWQLAYLGNQSPSSEICFPIIGKNSVDTQVSIAKSTFGMPDEAISIVKSLQPYNSGDAHKAHHLWRLNTLWNIDKHRNVAIHSSISDEIVWLPKGTNVKWEEIDNGAIMTFSLSAAKNMRLNPRPGIDVRFGDEKKGILVTLQDFRDMYDFVSGEVIPRFESFFS